MTTSLHFLRARFALATFAVGTLLVSADRAQAQADLTFSGAGNTPFVFTLSTPISYTINASLTGSAPFFIFRSTGGTVAGQRGVTGTVSFTINGGPAQTISTENSGVGVGSGIAASDLFIFGTSAALPIGTVLTLSSGTLTTLSNAAGTPPASGSFVTYITDSAGLKVSTNGLAVPEPTTWAMLGLGGSALLGFRRRRDRAAVRQS